MKSVSTVTVRSVGGREGRESPDEAVSEADEEARGALAVVSEGVSC
jgi:hypothetical protein